MKYKVGDLVKFNRVMDNEKFFGKLAVIIEIYPADRFKYKVRTLRPDEPSIHISGHILEKWVDTV